MRGEFRVRNYLLQQSVNKAPIKPDDPSLQTGMKDLETVEGQTPTPCFTWAWRGRRPTTWPAPEGLPGWAENTSRTTPALQRRAEPRGGGRAGRPVGMGRARRPSRWRPARAERPDRHSKTDRQRRPAARPPPRPARRSGRRCVLAHDQQYADAVKAARHRPPTSTSSGVSRCWARPRTRTAIRPRRSSSAAARSWRRTGSCKTSSTLPGYLDVAKGKDAAKAVDDLLAHNKDLTTRSARRRRRRNALKKALEAANKDTADAKKERKRSRRTWTRPRRTWTRPRTTWRRKRRTWPPPRRRPRT